MDKRYRTVVVDPPWPSSGYLRAGWGKGTANECGCGGQREVKGKHACNFLSIHRDHGYQTMELSEIASIDLPLADDAHVFLWTINRFLPRAFDVLEAWGLRYLFTGAWIKSNGPRPVGYPAYNTEWYLCAAKGKPKFATTRGFRLANGWSSPRKSGTNVYGGEIVASAKPEGFYELLRRITEGPRLDMFNRRPIEGFDTWGDEAETMEAVNGNSNA